MEITRDFVFMMELLNKPQIYLGLTLIYSAKHYDQLKY